MASGHGKAGLLVPSHGISASGGLGWDSRFRISSKSLGDADGLVPHISRTADDAT